MHDWANYPKGVVKFLIEAGGKIDSGFDIAYNGNIPNGAGLSSSASIELLTGVILRDLFDLPFEMLDLVKIGKKVENKFIGVNSGIIAQSMQMKKAQHRLEYFRYRQFQNLNQFYHQLRLRTSPPL